MPRTKEVYDGRTWTAQQERIAQALAENHWLVEQLGKEWCERELLFKERRIIGEVHPLFFRLGSSLSGDRRLIRDLRFFLDHMASRFPGLLRKLMADRDRQYTVSTMYQLHAFCVLRQRGFQCDWEPRTVGDRRADVYVPLTGDRQLFIEAFTVFPMQDDRVHDELSNWLRIQVNAIPDLAYMVSPWFQGCLTQEKAKWLLEAIRRDIASGELPRAPIERIEKTYTFDGIPVATVKYELSDDGKGFFAGPGQEVVRQGENAAHIKNKLLDKLEKFQLPPRPALSCYLMCLENYWGGLIDVVDALKGNPKMAITRDGRFRDTRDPNGVIHHKKGWNLSEVDCIIVVERPSNEWTRDDVKFLMNEQGLLSRDEAESLFFDPQEKKPPLVLSRK
ncbi:MAG: hypothetical protein PHI23_02990 [Candidatus Peribacteraceae bacterium]|nr:hypothetical protein [Candidatus Peribacteraceae bacterium]